MKYSLKDWTHFKLILTKTKKIMPITSIDATWCRMLLQCRWYKDDKWSPHLKKQVNYCPWTCVITLSKCVRMLRITWLSIYLPIMPVLKWTSYTTCFPVCSTAYLPQWFVSSKPAVHALIITSALSASPPLFPLLQPCTNWWPWLVQHLFFLCADGCCHE